MADAVEIRATTVAEMQAQAGKLMADHWAEATDGKHGLDIDWGRYDMLEEAGYLSMLAAWDGDELAGYVIGLATTRLQSKAVGVIVNEAFYVVPSYRPTALARRLLEAVEADARERWNEAHVAISAPIGGRMDQWLSGLKDYKHRESVYVKEIG